MAIKQHVQTLRSASPQIPGTPQCIAPRGAMRQSGCAGLRVALPLARTFPRVSCVRWRGPACRRPRMTTRRCHALWSSAL
eukprot:7641037-Alexandrium_andersonii.AAC.1